MPRAIATSTTSFAVGSGLPAAMSCAQVRQLARWRAVIAFNFFPTAIFSMESVP
jgi:hypothetical protein